MAALAAAALASAWLFVLAPYQRDRILDVVEPLLGEDCHIIANTAWRNPPRAQNDHGGGHWHIDAGPHVPRPPGVPWDDRIPYPVFAIGIHLLLEPCPLACGPTEVLAGSHRSGQALPLERGKLALELRAAGAPRTGVRNHRINHA